MTLRPGWILLVIAIWLSGLGVVYSSHQTRHMHAEVNRLTQIHDDLMVEWGRLTLEQGALASPMLLEQRAGQLQLREPESAQIELLPEVSR
ncbi:cell division protein FtsL [Natronospirillum operosum]|uniref:Cell division protein FtsL n=1 Tax=Natronospirillum operosum TaxID=2759953 RepID=A0A4Z0WCI8_9GAMM|nr:cell division protein FtsL [Natronospirillum operosum]TGG92720.1 cell division protein FtsL [Natronospirillum operosum]